MADYKKIDLQIGTEEQFEEKKLSLPVGTLVGITDPIHEAELDTDLQTKINEVSNKLTAPTTPTADSAVTITADGTVGTKPLTSITGKSEVYVGSTTPTNEDEILWINPDGTSSGGGSSGGGKLYRHSVYVQWMAGDFYHGIYFNIYSADNTNYTFLSLPKNPDIYNFGALEGADDGVVYFLIVGDETNTVINNICGVVYNKSSSTNVVFESMIDTGNITTIIDTVTEI